MRKNNKFLVVITIFMCLIFTSFPSYALSNSGGNIDNLRKSKSEQIEKFIKKEIKKGKIPGMSVVIVDGKNTIYQKGFGYADVKNKNQVTSESQFELGSNSKAFTALGILNLEHDGLINLNDNVNQYIPWFKVKYKGRYVDITIEQLLHHTSGIPFRTIAMIPVSNSNDAIEKTVKKLINIELDSKPGDKFQYATVNYDILALIIHNATGISYEKYIESNILQPMNLYNTYMYKNKVPAKNMTKGYKIQFFNQQEYNAPIYRGNKPAGYIISNAIDMAKWLKIQIDCYKYSKFSKNIIKESHMPDRSIPPSEDGASYASGWEVYQKGSGEISHGGSNPNYSSYIVFRPGDKIGVAVLSNTDSDYISIIGQGINDILLGKSVNDNIKDLNKSIDIIGVLIISISALISIFALYFLINAIKEIVKKKRRFNKKNIKDIFIIFFSMIFIAGLCYSIFRIPYILYSGVDWNFVFVWLPKSIEIALYLIYISISIIYLYFVVTNFYIKKDDKSILMLSILGGVSGLGNSLIIFTINMAISSSNELRLKLLIYFFLGIILYVYGQKIMRTKLIEVTNNYVYSKRIEIVKQLLKYSYDKFERIEKGRIESTLNNDTETVSRFINILISGITSAITLICCFGYLGFINKYALILSIVIIVLIAGIYYLVGMYANRIGEESRNLQNSFFKFINDLVHGFKELSLNKKKKNEFKDDMKESCYNYRIKRGQASLAFANMDVIGELLFTLAIGAVTFIFPLILKNLQTTNIASYVFILLYMTGPVHGILDTIPSVVEVKISLNRIRSLLDEISFSEMNYDYHNANDSDEKNIRLKLNQVEYSYDKNDEQSFKVGPINYEFSSGEIIFITGGNGSGKSTLAKLLTGLYEPSNGYITLNDNEINQKILGENYSTVFSDFYLFDKIYGIDLKDREKEINNYLKLLRLEDKVKVENRRFSTIKLSTGQRKRLALFITYLEDKPICIFDEWAADQDPEFRLFFYKTLLPELKKRGKCVIAISHDDRYFDDADKIIKMELGKIVNVEAKER